MPPLWGWSPRRAERFFGHLIHMLEKKSLKQTEWSGTTDNQHPISIKIPATLVLETNHQCHPHGDLSHSTLSEPPRTNVGHGRRRDGNVLLGAPSPPQFYIETSLRCEGALGWLLGSSFFLTSHVLL